MGTVVELNGTGHLDDAYFVVKRLFHETSCEEASRISREGGNEHLADFARSVMDRRVNVAATDAELATGGQFSFPLPTFPENREDVQFLCSVCHGQDTQILDLMGEMLKLKVDRDDLEFFVERICLPKNFDMALTLFEAAKIEMVSAVIEEIATTEEDAAKIDELLLLPTTKASLMRSPLLPTKSPRLKRSRLLPSQSRIAALVKRGTSSRRLRTASSVLLSLQ